MLLNCLVNAGYSLSITENASIHYVFPHCLWPRKYHWMIGRNEWWIGKYVTCLSIYLEEPWENHKKLVNMVNVPFTHQTVYFLITSVAEAKIWKCIVLVTSLRAVVPILTLGLLYSTISFLWFSERTQIFPKHK